jgi:hypothetical protein
VKHTHKGSYKPSDVIPQPIGIVLGGNLRQNAEPLKNKPAKQPSPMQLEERERLVAEIKRHHPKATTEQIIRHLEAWGSSSTRLVRKGRTPSRQRSSTATCQTRKTNRWPTVLAVLFSGAVAY